MGLKVALKLFDHAKGIIGIEDNKPEAIRIMKEKTANEPDIEVKELKTKYPQGGERCLIYATTGRSITPLCYRQMRAVSYIMSIRFTLSIWQLSKESR